MDRQSIIILSGFGLLIIGGLFWQFSDVFNRIPVKTYYGCCQMCVSKIRKNTDNVRYATDPFSGEKVNKANAFITLRPGQGKGVYYFISEKNMRSYFK